MRLNKYLKENLLLEKTFNISKDVKYIYEKAFKKYIDSLVKNNFKSSKFSNIDTKIKNGDDHTLLKIHSDELSSKESKKANIINPSIIKCGIYRSGNFYKPNSIEVNNRKFSLIQISLHKQVLNLIFNNKENVVPQEQIKDFYQELKPERIKATIAHELSHWLNDTFHNFHITKIIDIAKELNNPDILKLKKQNVNMSHFEIDAQIHGLKQLKMSNKKIWDKLELKDLFFKYVALRTTGKSIYSKYGKQIGDIWQKTLVKRLNREKLLGKNMIKFAKYPEDFKN